MGITFPNRVGLAAGLDKNAAHIDGLATFGFGFLEVGTVTPRAAAGQSAAAHVPPAARRTRSSTASASTTTASAALVANVERARYRGVLGINIGRNFDTPNERAADDYVACLRAVYAKAHYVTVNISSPNTKGLRDLQAEDALDGAARRAEARAGGARAERTAATCRSRSRSRPT